MQSQRTQEVCYGRLIFLSEDLKIDFLKFENRKISDWTSNCLTSLVSDVHWHLLMVKEEHELRSTSEKGDNSGGGGMPKNTGGRNGESQLTSLARDPLLASQNQGQLPNQTCLIWALNIRQSDGWPSETLFVVFSKCLLKKNLLALHSLTLWKKKPVLTQPWLNPVNKHNKINKQSGGSFFPKQQQNTALDIWQIRGWREGFAV